MRGRTKALIAVGAVLAVGAVAEAGRQREESTTTGLSEWITTHGTPVPLGTLAAGQCIKVTLHGRTLTATEADDLQYPKGGPQSFAIDAANNSVAGSWYYPTGKEGTVHMGLGALPPRHSAPPDTPAEVCSTGSHPGGVGFRVDIHPAPGNDLTNSALIVG